MNYKKVVDGTIGLINLYYYEIMRSQEIKENYEVED